MNRRTLLQASVAAAGGAVATRVVPAAEAAIAFAQAPPTSQSKPLGAFPLGEMFQGWQGSMIEVTYPPGAASAAHQHPGPTFGYVVRGSIRWAINGEAPRVLDAGQSFFEPMGSVHSTAANASDKEPAVLSVVILGRTGEPLSKPLSKPGGDDPAATT